MDTVKSYAKAIIGAIIAGLGALTTALADKNGVSAYEWVTVALAFFIALGGVAVTPNQRVKTNRR